MSKTKLGRGLDNLIEENEINQTINETVQYLNLNEIKPRENQPRKYFEKSKIEELAASIDNYGIIQPIVVSKSNEGYKIIAGERRYQAASVLKLDKIPCIVRDYNPNRISELALIENIQRENLSSIEEASAIKALIDQYGYTHEDIAKKLGKSRSHVTNLVGMLSLPNGVIELVLEKKLTMGHARALSKLNDFEKIEQLAKKVIDGKMSVRQVENMIRKNGVSNESKPKYHQISLLGASVEEIIVSKKSIELKFKSSSELNKFLEIIENNGKK